MQQKTVVVLELMQEINKCCEENGIAYTCGGLFPRALVKHEDLIIQQGVIYVDVNDIRSLVELLGNSSKSNREIEFADGMNNYTFFSARYIDSSTTFINNRSILLYEKPGIHVEILPVIHTDPDEESGNDGLLFGNKRIKANSFYAAVDHYTKDRNEDAPSYVQDATGEVKAFEHSLITDTEKRFFNGFEIQISKDINKLFDLLYLKEDGTVSYPRFPRIDNIITAEVSYKELMKSFGDIAEWGNIIDSQLSRIDELNNRIDQREEKIQGILDEVRQLYAKKK